MAHYTDEAIVLRRSDYSETSQIITVLTRARGRISLIAKGIRRGTQKHFATGVDLLEAGQLVWSARPDAQQELFVLTEWQPFRAFSGLREDLRRLYAAQYAAEVTVELTNELDPFEALFDAMMAFLEGASGSNEPMIELCDYLWLLLHEIGLSPQLDNCMGCRRAVSHDSSEPLHFSSFEGGCICRDCEAGYVEKRRVDARVLSMIGRQGSPAPMTFKQSAAVFDLLDYHIAHLAGRRPRLAEWVLPDSVRRRL